VFCEKPPGMAVFCSFPLERGEGVRTLDPNLGKVVQRELRR
jgi:hypothetical protein